MVVVGLCIAGLSGCGGHAQTAPPSATRVQRPSRLSTQLVSVLRLPRVRSRILPGYLLVADRNNDRVLLLSPNRRIVWRRRGLHEPDDAFFTPGYRGVITNEEFDETLTEISLRTKGVVWAYGHAGVAGRAPGYLDAPDDAYRLANGVTTVADIQNCRIVEMKHDRSVLRVLGRSCVHDPPRGFASPNGDTPLPDGGMLVTEIGGWVDRIDRFGKLVWSVRTPFSYPSDAQLLPNGRILVCAFTTPGRVVEMTRSGRIVWSFGASSGRNRLDRPSLAIRLPNGFVAINDDWRHRVIVVNPQTNRIVWQYGHTDHASRRSGYLDKPDGMDFLPASAMSRTTVTAPGTTARQVAHQVTQTLSVTRIGALPAAASRLAAVAVPGGRVVALGGLVNGTSSSQILAGRPNALRRIGSLPVPTHDAAAVAYDRGTVELLGGGAALSTPSIVRIDATTGQARRLPSLDEPLSDLGRSRFGVALIWSVGSQAPASPAQFSASMRAAERASSPAYRPGPDTRESLHSGVPSTSRAVSRPQALRPPCIASTSALVTSRASPSCRDRSPMLRSSQLAARSGSWGRRIKLGPPDRPVERSGVARSTTPEAPLQCGRGDLVRRTDRRHRWGRGAMQCGYSRRPRGARDEDVSWVKGIATRNHRLASPRATTPSRCRPATIYALVCALALLWLVARPSGEQTRNYVGQFLGAESILLLSIGLVLVSTLPWVEEWFDGIDRAAIWHRRVAIAGLVLLAPHILLSSSPDGTALGGPLGAIGAIGLVALAVWAILPRWESVLPSPLRGAVRAVRDAHVLRVALACSEAMNSGGPFIERPGSSSRRDSFTECWTARRSTTPRSCVGASSPSER